MASQSWKNLERHVASTINGIRIYRGADFSASMPDVVGCNMDFIPGCKTPVLVFAECKYRSYQPYIARFNKLCNGKKVIYLKDVEFYYSVIVEKSDFYCFDLKDFKDIKQLIDPNSSSYSVQDLTNDVKSGKYSESFVAPSYIIEWMQQGINYYDQVTINKIGYSSLQKMHPPLYKSIETYNNTKNTSVNFLYCASFLVIAKKSCSQRLVCVSKSSLDLITK